MKIWVYLVAIVCTGLLVKHVELDAPPVAIEIVPDYVAKLPGYDTLEEAGVAAIERAYKCSHVYECGGVIGRRDSDGKFIVGPVRSDDAGDHVSFSDSTPPGVTKAATYHTHPCLAESHAVDYFSPADIEGDLSEHTIGFMGNLCTGDVHEYDPLTMKPDSDVLVLGDGETIYLTKGKVVGKIKVDGKSAEPTVGMI